VQFSGRGTLRSRSRGCPEAQGDGSSPASQQAPRPAWPPLTGAAPRPSRDGRPRRTAAAAAKQPRAGSEPKALREHAHPPRTQLCPSRQSRMLKKRAKLFQSRSNPEPHNSISLQETREGRGNP